MIFLCMAVTACQSGDDFDKMPQSVMKFVTQYWPNPAVTLCQQNDDGTWLIEIKNGPTLTFNSSEQWQTVNGNGVPVPQVLLFDRLPSKLYDYLENGEYLDEVFEIVKSPREIMLQLHRSKVYYTIENENIRQEYD